MKHFSLGRSFARLVAGTVLAIFTTGPAFAVGGGAAGGVGAASAGSAGAAGGGHGGGAASTGGVHAASPVGLGGGGRSFGGSPAGFTHLGGTGLVPTTGVHRFNGSSIGGTSALRSPYNNYAGTARQGGTGNVGTLRSPYNNYAASRSVSNVGVPRGNYANNAAISRSTYGSTGIGNASAQGTNNPYAIRVAPQTTNAWTDPRSTRGATPAARASRYGYNGAYDQNRSYLQDTLAPGQHLYPGAPGYTPTNGAFNHSGNYGRYGNRSLYGGYHNGYYNTGLYYPYLYSAFFPGYFGYFGDAFVGGYSGEANLDAENNFNNSAANAAVTNNTPGYWEQQRQQPQGNPGVDKDTTPPTDDAPLPPSQPKSVGPQAPGADAAPSTLRDNGPDSMVEAVQTELASRGYYAGKVDSVYGDSTREALRRFQTDQRLNATGRINEATLHALHLD